MLQSTHSDAAMREALDQLRQAREYSITHSQYVQASIVVVGVSTTQRNLKLKSRSGGGTNHGRHLAIKRKTLAHTQDMTAATNVTKSG